MLEKMELDETGFPQPTGELEELEADSLVLALGQEADLSLLDGVPGIEVDGRRRRGRPEHDDRPPGDLRRRRHGARRADRDGRGRARQEGRASHRRAGCAASSCEPPPKHELATFDKLNTWYYADAPRTVQPRLETGAAGARPSTRSSAGWTSRTRCSKPAAACRAGTASRATTATACAPTTPCSSWASPASSTRSISTSARVAASASPSARAARSRWCRKRFRRAPPAPPPRARPGTR